MQSPASRIARLLLLLIACAAPAFAGTDRWTPAPSPGVAVSQIVFHPHAPATLWILSSTVYKSEDGGASFHFSGSGLENLYIRFLAIDPGRPDVLYAATGLIGGTTGLGVYRSPDGGAHWTLAVGGADLATINSLAIAPGPPGTPGAPGVIFFSNLFHLYRSADDGATFQTLPALDSDIVIAVAPDLRNPGTVYAASLSQRFKSTDFGVTWTGLVEAPGLHPFIHDLVVTPSDSQTLYETGTNTELAATWRSRDGGATWQGPFPFQGDVLAVDPEDSDTVYGGNPRGLFVSHDGGETFTEMTSGLPPLNSEAGSYQELFAVRADPVRPGHAFVCTVQGLFVTADTGTTWQAAPRAGLPSNSVETFQLDPFDPAHWIVSSLGTWFESHDRGQTFTLLADSFARNVQVDAVAFDPFLPHRLWSLVLQSPSSKAGLYLSKDDGASWDQISGGVFGASLLLPVPRVLLVKDFGPFVYRSGDAGHSWRFIARVGDRPLVQDPRNPRTIYDEAGAFRSDDAGRHWRPWHNVSPHQAIGFDPFQPQTLHLVQDDTLLVTRDNGKTFRSVGRLPLQGSPRGVLKLLFDRERSGVLYAATEDDGILRSQDGGVTWEPVNTGLKGPRHRRAINLVQDPVDGRRFYITPESGGIYAADFSGGPS